MAKSGTSAAERAIKRSVSHNEIVTLPWDKATRDELDRLSEDGVKGNEVWEFWGTTDEGDQWRVHMSFAKSEGALW